MTDGPHRLNWDALWHLPINEQFITEMDCALLMGDTETVTALLEWREAYVVVGEFWEHCDRHPRLLPGRRVRPLPSRGGRP